MSDNGPTSRRPFYKIFISFLIVFFSVYNYFIYTQSTPSEIRLSSLAIKGQQIFQDNNCVSCHQIYGLGGYLGPDITNVISKRGDPYFRAMLQSGVKSMPKFDFSENEANAISQFLKEVDQTGIYPNMNSKVNAFGWVDIDYKSRTKGKK
jgi:nitric oxide reductase subunit C